MALLREPKLRREKWVQRFDLPDASSKDFFSSVHCARSFELGHGANEALSAFFQAPRYFKDTSYIPVVLPHPGDLLNLLVVISSLFPYGKRTVH